MKNKILLITTITSIITFLALYGWFLLRPLVEPSSKATFLWDFVKDNFYGQIGVFIMLSLIFLNFVFLLKYKKDEGGWRTKGIYVAFIISLFAEMCGSLLIVYFFAPFFKYPVLVTAYRFSRLHTNLYGLAVFLILTALILITVSWRTLYNSKGLVTNGIYKYVRHPQYIGFIMIVVGWLMLWLSVIMIVLAPVYIGLYIYQAIREDRYLMKNYGNEFINYKKNVSIFSLIKKQHKVAI